MQIIVIPRSSLILFKSLTKLICEVISCAEKGSSRINTFGLTANNLAKAILCRSPPLNPMLFLFNKAGLMSTVSINFFFSVLTSSFFVPDNFNASLIIVLIFLYGLIKLLLFWNNIWIFRGLFLNGVILLFKTNSPLVGLIIPAINFARVDFTPPDSPQIPRTYLSFTVKETSNKISVVSLLLRDKLSSSTAKEIFFNSISFSVI